MTDPLAFFWQHDLQVTRFAGVGAAGDTYDAPVDITGFVDDGQRLVTGPNGEQITSTARLYLPITTAAIPLRSQVTLSEQFGGDTREVVAVARCDLSELDMPVHWELALV